MVTNEDRLSRPSLPYAYEFEAGDYQGIIDCVEAHGFAIARNVIPLSLALELRDDVIDTVAPGGWPADVTDFTFHGLIEVCPAIWKLFETEHYLPFAQASLGESLTILRSAAIIRAPGSQGMRWHSDTPVKAGNASDTLNMNARSYSGTMYLTGMQPDDSGLALLPDSHLLDNPAPPGFVYSEDRKLLHRADDEQRRPHADMDVPGMIAPIAAPNDRVFFHRYTFHGVFPHRGQHLRISTGGVSFRPSHVKLDVEWELSDRARQFIASAPAKYADLVAGYVGYPQDHIRQPIQS